MPRLSQFANNSARGFGMLAFFEPPYDVDIEYLVIAGGGGNFGLRPGGAGGYVAGTITVVNKTLTTATVGAGLGGSSGSDSTYNIVTAYGGGRGATDGGSGGGGGTENGSSNQGNSIQTSPAGGTGYGFAGGNKISGSGNAGGGGGGAGAVGGNCISTSGKGGVGGAGRSSSITGSAVTRAGGGGGGGNSAKGANAGFGGSGGGGLGAQPGVTATNGTVNKGGGGGGSYYAVSLSGGSGVIILSVATAIYSGITTGSPIVTTSGANTIMVFNSSGTYTS